MGGSGSSYTNLNTDRLTELVRDQANESAQQFEAELAAYLSKLRSTFARDAELVRERLDKAKEALQGETEYAYDLLFAGSVAKHTYVDGFSDIDTLLVINDSKFEHSGPEEILDSIQGILRAKLPENVVVDHGAMAVSIKYPDDMVIQLLPALRTDAGVKVPSSRRAGWADIEPDGFRQALTSSNERCGGKLIPTIKLAKAVIANMPEEYRLTGYHVESLAIAAFKVYEGKKTTETMLPLLFEHARRLVLSPIKDSTGQSVHVDEYLGTENSALRQSVSHLLGGIAKRMRNASAGKSQAQWEAMFASD